MESARRAEKPAQSRAPVGNVAVINVAPQRPKPEPTAPESPGENGAGEGNGPTSTSPLPSSAPVHVGVAPVAVPTSDDEGAPVFDESAEAAFLGEARDRGEPVTSARAAAGDSEEVDPKSLPPLDALVQKIPAAVRETLDELFRAKFVRVQRVPRKALKS